MAADEAPAAKAEDQELTEVQVTGTRIRRTTDFTTATPTTVIDESTMQNLGVVNVGDVLAITPANISNFTPATTGMSSFNTGAYIADLRGLNPFFGSRTLTLIDSQRPASTNTLDSFDLNLIPQVLVQRVDSVTGGGSASYGSGAVAGAVNVILNRKLEGLRFDADTYATRQQDAKSNHVAFAYGHGLYDDRVHFVIGGEYSKQDPARCQDSGRDWCSANYGPYQVATAQTAGLGTAALAINQLGSGLTTNVNPYGVYGAAAFNPATFQYNGTAGPLTSSVPDGLGTIPFTANSSAFAAAAPGGDGTLANQYANLMTATKRDLLTALVTADLTDNIKLSADLSWGKVWALNPLSTFQITTGTVLGFDNPYLQALTGKDSATLQSEADAAAGPGSPGYVVAKDWNQQIPDVQFNNTTLKQASVGLDGRIADSSWTWSASALYGKTDNVQGSNHEPTVLGFSMATDAVAGGCRVSQGLANAYASALTGYDYQGFNGTGLPVWAQVYQGLANYDPVNPVSGLTESQTMAYLAGRGCQPLNPFGTLPLSASTVDYATGPLSLALKQTMTSFNLSTSGDFYEGVGAGPFSLAVGYEWHKEVTKNDFASCPGARNTLGNADLTDAQRECLAIATDFAYQFGNDYGGSSTYNEIFAELNFPLLKGAPGAELLELNLAGRESFYKNVAQYGVNVVPGTKGDGSLPTWKASLVYEPIAGVRFRGSQSHDSRAPSPRDLYYSQSFVPGSPFGWCYSGDFSTKSLCTINLLGNVDLKPETANTTTLGLVFTPEQVRGLQASADWFHIKLKNGIEGGNAFSNGTYCFQHQQAFCDQMQFNPNYYDASGAVVAEGTAGANTGAAAFQQGNVANVVGEDGAAFNGGYFETSGIDFSLSYSTSLPGGSHLSARALTTYIDKQKVQDTPGGTVFNTLGQATTSTLLQNYQAAMRWRGNASVTWSTSHFDVTPNVTWVGSGKINNYALNCSAADFADTSSLCNWAANSYYAGPSQTPAQLAASGYAYTLLPAGLKNHVGDYFQFGLNVGYTLDKIPGVKSLQLWGQVNNLFDRKPTFTNSTTGSAAFYDQLGQAYRVGFRMNLN